MKRLIALALCLVSVLSLTACGKKDGSGKAGEGEQITLTIGIPTQARVTEWDNNKLTLWLEEKTGYDLKFVHLSSTTSEAVTQLTTMISGGERLPDLLLAFSPGGAVVQMLADGGYIRDLGAEFFDNEEVMKNYDYDEMIKKNLDPEVYQQLVTFARDSKGRWLGFPYVTGGQNDRPKTMMYINRQWLENLGLEMPTTLDELYDVCEAFKTQDPNGNGKPDEIPMLGGVNIGRGDIPAWIINHFIYVNDTYMYDIDDDGNVYLPYGMDEYREGLKVANKFYKAGLLSPLTWTMKDRSEMTAMFTPADEVAKVGVVATHLLTNTTQDNAVLWEYAPLTPFEGAYAAHGPASLTYSNFITTDCEHPEAAFNLLCVLATPEGLRAQRYGEEGVDWQWVTDKYTGQQAIEQINPDAFSGQTDSTWGLNINCTYWSTTGDDGKDPAPSVIANTEGPEEEDNWTQRRTRMNRKHAALYMARAAETDPKNLMFKVAYTDEEDEALGTMETDILTYVTQARAKFTTGEWDVHSDAAWKSYCDTIEKMGAEKIIAINQAAWDRQQAQIAALDLG